MIDNMNSRDLDIDIGDVEGFNERFGICLLINMNKFHDRHKFACMDYYITWRLSCNVMI